MKDNVLLGRGIVIFFVLILLTMFGGCVAIIPGFVIPSLGYHVDMVCGNYEPKPYPLTRYASEMDTWHFKQEYMTPFIFGLPLKFPCGYCADVLIDTIFLPIDLPLSYLVDKPSHRIIETETGKSRLVICGPYTQIHYYAKDCQGIVPLTITIQEGALTFTSGDAQSVLLTRESIKSSGYERDWFGYDYGVKYKKEMECGKMILYCVPQMLHRNQVLFIGYNGHPELLFTSWEGNKMLMAVALNNEPTTQTVRIIPSSDFKGSVTYQGQPIDEILFTTKRNSGDSAGL